MSSFVLFHITGEVRYSLAHSFSSGDKISNKKINFMDEPLWGWIMWIS